MRRFLVLLVVALAVASVAAPASASDEPCVINCIGMRTVTNQ